MRDDSRLGCSVTVSLNLPHKGVYTSLEPGEERQAWFQQNLLSSTLHVNANSTARVERSGKHLFQHFLETIASSFFLLILQEEFSENQDSKTIVKPPKRGCCWLAFSAGPSTKRLQTLDCNHSLQRLEGRRSFLKTPEVMTMVGHPLGAGLITWRSSPLWGQLTRTSKTVVSEEGKKVVKIQGERGGVSQVSYLNLQKWMS